MFLVQTLWVVAILTIVALSLLTTSNTSYHRSHNAVFAAQRDAVAEAAIARAVIALLDTRPERRWRVDSTPQAFEFDNLKMQIAIQDELGRIDLNHADQSLLIRLLQSAGVDVTAASALVDKILDWRDPLPGKRVNGVNQLDYRAAGFAYSPRGGPFQSVEELKLVIGMTPVLYQRIEPALTVYSGRQFFDPQFAQRAALEVLTGMNAHAVTAALASRVRQGPRDGIINPAIPLRGRAFSISVQFDDDVGGPHKEVVVRLTGDPAQPYWVLNWRTR